MTMGSAASRPWLRSASWDGFWLLSGIWLVPVVVLLERSPAKLYGFLVASSLLLWLAHRFATAFSAFCMADYRGLLKAQFGRFIGWPSALLLAPFALVFAPSWAVPLDLWGRAQILAAGFFLFNTYHFGVQHYGVISVYRIRAGQDPADPAKRLERFTALAVGGVLVAIGQIGHGAEVVQDSLAYEIIGWGGVFGTVRVVALVAIAALIGALLAAEARQPRSSLPKMLYVSGLGVQAVLAFFLSPVAFLVLWGVQHWLVSIAFAAVMSENSLAVPRSDSAWYRFWHRIGHGFWPTVGVLVVISIALSPLFEFATRPYKAVPQAVQGLKSFVESGGWHSFWVALAFGTVYAHFAMDRAVFRFSDHGVRQVTAPLLFGKRR